MAEEENNINLPGRFAVYGAVGGKPAVVARFEDNDVWLTQKQLADLFNTIKQLVSYQIRQIIDNYTGDAMQRCSWDPVTVDFTVNGENEFYSLSEAGHIRATRESSVFFVPCELGNAHYLLFSKPDSEISHRISNRVRYASHLPVFA